MSLDFLNINHCLRYFISTGISWPTFTCVINRSGNPSSTDIKLVSEKRSTFCPGDTVTRELTVARKHHAVFRRNEPRIA